MPTHCKAGVCDLDGTGCSFLLGAIPHHYRGAIVCHSPLLFLALGLFSSCCTRVLPDSCTSCDQTSTCYIRNKLNAQVSDCSTCSCHYSSCCCSIVIILRPATVHFHPLRWSQIDLCWVQTILRDGWSYLIYRENMRCLHHSHSPDLSHNPGSLVKRRVWDWETNISW